MGNPRTPSPCLSGLQRSDRSHDAVQDASMQESPRGLLSPNSSKSEVPSHKLLFAYHHVLRTCWKSALSLPSLIRKKTAPEPLSTPRAQPRSIMSLRLDRLKDRLRDCKKRSSPASFRHAGHVFLAVILIAFCTVIVGWYGLLQETLNHNSGHNATMPDPEESLASLWLISPRSQLEIRAYEDTPQASSTANAPLEQFENITVVETIILTVTNIITNTALKTLTTTVLLSTCTTCITTPTIGESTNTMTLPTPATQGVMTGIMYCSFTGRRNIYTLCPHIHTDSPAMLTGAPAMVSSTTSRMKNPLSAVRIAAVSLWNSLPSLGSIIQPKDHGRGECAYDIAGMNKKLDAAMDLVRVQQRLLDSQRAMINEHRKSLVLALETLANLTASRASENAHGGRSLDLKI